MAQVHREPHFSGNDVPGIRFDLHEADRSAAVRLVRQRNAIHFFHDARRGEHRVLAQAHRRGSGVSILPGNNDVVPAQPKCAGHHADGVFSIFEDRTLFDVRFEVGGKGPAHRNRSCVPDSLQFISNRFAVDVFLRERVIQRERACEHAGTHHHRCKACALFVGPDCNLEGMRSLDAPVVQRTHDLERGKHAVVAIEFPAGGLGIDVAAGHHWRQVVLASRATRKNIADGVDADGAAGGPQPAANEIAALAVPVGQRNAAHAAFRGGADSREIHERLPEALAVYACVVHDGDCDMQFNARDNTPWTWVVFKNALAGGDIGTAAGKACLRTPIRSPVWPAK